MSNFFNRIFAWIWQSSADPSQVSLTVKGFLSVLVGAIIPALGLAHVNVGVDAVNSVIDNVDIAITAILTGVGAVGAIVGFVRKVIVTFNGKNAAIQTPQAPSA